MLSPGCGGGEAPDLAHGSEDAEGFVQARFDRPPSTADGRFGSEQPAAARLSVLYWPAAGECPGPEQTLKAELRRFLEERGDIEILTVLPADLAAPAGEGQVLGTPVSIPRQAWEAERRLSPFPRVEAWTGRGTPERRLLLLESVPPQGVRAAALVESLRWSLSHTEPVRAPEEHGPAPASRRVASAEIAP